MGGIGIRAEAIRGIAVRRSSAGLRSNSQLLESGTDSVELCCQAVLFGNGGLDVCVLGKHASGFLGEIRVYGGASVCRARIHSPQILRIWRRYGTVWRRNPAG